MKTWTIPVTWSVYSTVEVEANTLEEAMEIAEDENNDIPCPPFPEYVDGSWQLSHNKDEIEFVRKCYNGNQEDEREDD